MVTFLCGELGMESVNIQKINTLAKAETGKLRPLKVNLNQTHVKYSILQNTNTAKISRRGDLSRPDPKVKRAEDQNMTMMKRIWQAQLARLTLQVNIMIYMILHLRFHMIMIFTLKSFI